MLRFHINIALLRVVAPLRNAFVSLTALLLVIEHWFIKLPLVFLSCVAQQGSIQSVTSSFNCYNRRLA
jgi:hypothetical protein